MLKLSDHNILRFEFKKQDSGQWTKFIYKNVHWTFLHINFVSKCLRKSLVEQRWSTTHLKGNLMGRIICYVKNAVRGLRRTKRAHKVLKWDFHYDAIYQSVRKLHHSIFSRFLKCCWILKTVNDNNNYNKNYFKRYYANYVFLHVIMKKYWIDLQHTFCLLMNRLKKLSEKY